MGLSFLFFIFFGVRLLKLKEEHFEYGYVLSWPPKVYIVNQLKAGRVASNLFPLIRRFQGIEKQVSAIPKYPCQKGILTRAKHWSYTESVDNRLACFFLAALFPIFYVVTMRNQPLMESFFQNPHSNFLLLVMTPVLITIGAQYQKMGYWGYDILKPVKRSQYMKEKGALLIAHLFLYWVLISLYLAILPNLVFQPELLITHKFWGYTLLTGTFAFVVFAWITVLSCVTRSSSVIVQGGLLSGLVLFQFYFVPYFSWEMVIGNNIFCLLLGLFLMRLAYKGWYQKEYV